MFAAVLWIRDILMRIRIPGSLPLFTDQDPVRAPDPDPTPDPTPFFIDFNSAKKKLIFFIFFLITCPQAHHVQSKKLNFC